MLVLGDRVLRLGGRRSVRLSCIGGCLEGEDVLFEEVLTDKFFQLPPKALAVNCSVSFTVMIRAASSALESIGSYCIGLRHLTRLVFVGIDDFIDGEFQRSEMFHLEVLWWIQREPGMLVFCRLVAPSSGYRYMLELHGATLTSFRRYRLSEIG